MTPPIRNILQESVVIAAHPDDEILWFSSVLAHVNELIVCFLEVPGKPLWTTGRANSLAEYPLQNLTRLDLTEANIFWDIDWDSPVETEYGLAMVTAGDSEDQYKSNFVQLQAQLHAKLAGVRNVFTHNSWGEYGNGEHVQLYRVLKALQQQFHFDLWVSSYFSNKSTKLMLRSMAVINGEHVTLPTNLELATRIADLYKKHACWTWYDNYCWPKEESFFRISQAETEQLRPGLVCPLQFIHVDTAQPSTVKPNAYRRLRKTARRIINRLKDY